MKTWILILIFILLFIILYQWWTIEHMNKTINDLVRNQI